MVQLTAIVIAIALLLSPQTAQPERRVGDLPVASQTGAGQGSEESAGVVRIEDFKSLLGRWRGTGSLIASGKPLTSTMTFTLSAAGKTVFVEAAEEAPNTFAYEALWSIGTGGDGVIMTLVSGEGDPSLYRSRGWVADRMIFEPDHRLGDGPGGDRFTYDRTPNGGFSITYELSRDGQTWRICDRQMFDRIR